MDLLTFPFFRNALLGLVFISLASALIGTYIVTRRTIFIAGGITHACFGGLGLGYYLGINPLISAAVFAVAGSLGVESMSARRVRKDSAIAVIWAAGMALGILFVFLAPGRAPELNSFLFGNVLTITNLDLYLFGALLIVIAGVYAIAYPLIVAVSFDADFSRTRQLPVGGVNIVMTILTALTIVLTIRMIGIMLLLSLISLPQMIAERFTCRYLRLMLLAGCVSLFGCIGGFAIAYVISVPASAAIVLLLTAFYGISVLIPSRRR